MIPLVKRVLSLLAAMILLLLLVAPVAVISAAGSADASTSSTASGVLEPAAPPRSESDPKTSPAIETTLRIKAEIEKARAAIPKSNLPMLVPASEAKAAATSAPPPQPENKPATTTAESQPEKQPAQPPAAISKPTAASVPETKSPAVGTQVKSEDSEKNDPKKLKLDIKGFRYFKYRQYGASGDSASFLSRSGLLTYGDKFEQGSNLRFVATQGKTKFTGDIEEMPLQERNMVFNLESGQYLATMGDFSSKFKGGNLASLNKRITGAEIAYKTKKLEIGMVSSQSKSESRTISFNGTNTHGPYDLKTFEILPGSVTVLLNGQALPSSDYDLDYFAGLITFCSTGTPSKCTNIKTSDTVQVIFEQKLLLALKGGNITGLSADYKLGKGSIGAAILTQEANMAGQRTRNKKTQTFTGDQLIAQGAFDEDKRTLSLDTTSTRYPSLVFIVKNTEVVSRNGTPLRRDTDFSVSYTGYGFGQILLAQTPAATDTYSVSFSYYVDTFINIALDEDISDNGQSTNIFYLSKYKIYPGLETLKLCRSEHCEIFELLEYGTNKDYTIDEENNAIIIHSSKRPNAADQSFIRANYFYVPIDAPNASPYSHSVNNIFGNYSFGDALSLKFEYASSLSDVSRTSVQIMNEIILPATATVTCPTSASPPPECIRTFAHDNIEEGSEAIRLNTRTIDLIRGADYTFDPTFGRLTFTNGLVIPQGTLVYASYRFLPVANIGLTRGGALRLSGDSKLKNISLNFTKETTDPAFAPIGGNNTLETDRLDYTLSMPIGKTLALSTTRSRFIIAQDIYELFSTTNTSNLTSLTYSAKSKSPFKRAKWTFGDTKAADNRAPSYDDTTRKNNSIGLEFDLPFVKNAAMNYSLQTENFTDNARRTDDTKSNNNSWVISYKPRDELSLDITLGTEKVSSSGVSDPFDTRTSSRNIQMTYQPVALVTIAASINSQKVKDSRPESESAGADTSTIRLSTKPFWKVRVFAFTFTAQDRPSQFTGGTKSDVANTTFTIASSKSFAITPMFTITQSSSPGSSSKTSLNSIKFEYLPPKKKYETVLTRDNSTTTSSSDTSAPSSSKSNRLAWDFKYKLSPTVNLIYRYSSYASSSTGSTTSSGETRNSFQVLHKVGEKLDIRAQYSILSTTGSAASSEDRFSLISQYKLGKHLLWNLDYSMSKYASGKPDGNYNGNLLETELKLDF